MARDREGDEGGHYAHRALSVILRIGQLICAAIVLGILSRFCYVLSIGEAHANGRIVYAMVVAGIGIIFAIIFCLPFNVLFMSFPFDFIMFAMWLVAFALLINQSPHCTTDWFNNYWGYYWGRFYRVGRTPGSRGCGYWRTAIAFSFIAAMAHLLSFILGIYVYRTYINVKDTVNQAKHHAEKLRKPRASDVSGARHSKRSGSPPSPVAHPANLAGQTNGQAPVTTGQQPMGTGQYTTGTGQPMGTGQQPMATGQPTVSQQV